MKLNEKMTLDNWIKNGGCMLSHWTSGFCCQIAKISEKLLRQMQLTDIYLIPKAGMVANREIDRFLKK